MKKLIPLYALLFLASCSMLMPTYEYKKALATTTAQKWSPGVQNAGRGVTFRVTFFQLDELKADTLWVNGIPLETEITRVGDTTYITSFVHATEQNPSTLVKEDVFTGKLQLLVKDKKKELDLGNFKQLPPTEYP